MSEIDYKTLYEKLVDENEQLRMKLFKSTLKPAWSFNFDQVRDFVYDNYLVIMVALFVLSSLVSGLYTLFKDRSHE